MAFTWIQQGGLQSRAGGKFGIQAFPITFQGGLLTFPPPDNPIKISVFSSSTK